MRPWPILGLGLLIAPVWVAPGETQMRGGRHGAVPDVGVLLCNLALTETQQA